MQSDKDVQAAIDAGNRRFVQAFTRGDAAAVAALYTSDAQLLPPNSDFVTGGDGIRKFWQGAMQMGIREVQLQTVGVETEGSRATELGRYTLLLDGGQVADSGKYLVVWKAEGGNWKLHRDVWNTSRPTQ